MRKLIAAFLFASFATTMLALAPQSSTLVQPADVEYIGGFMTPTNANIRYLNSGWGVAYDNDTLFVSNYENLVTQMTIPVPSLNTDAAHWPYATTIQTGTDILRGKIGQAGDLIGGLLVDGANLIVSVHIKYDASSSATRSHFVAPKDFAQTTVVGPVRLTDPPGFVGGGMARIPAARQAAFGGPILTGLNTVSIISRSSHGPAASVFDPADIVTGATIVPSTQVLAYPQAHPTLGPWNCRPDLDPTCLWNATMQSNGFVFVEGTDTVLYFGRRASTWCYGTGSSCNDPTSSSQGTHGYPYFYRALAYDVNDLLDVKNGLMQPWDVVPYTTWDLPITGPPKRTLLGVAYDPATQRIFVTEESLTGANRTGIRVFEVNVGATPPPPPPVPVDCEVSAWSVWSVWVPISPFEEERFRTRTVVTPAENGGAPCGALVEMETRAIVPDYDTEIAAVDAAAVAVADAQIVLNTAQVAHDASTHATSQPTLLVLNQAIADLESALVDLSDARAALIAAIGG